MNASEHRELEECEWSGKTNQTGIHKHAFSHSTVQLKGGPNSGIASAKFKQNYKIQGGSELERSEVLGLQKLQATRNGTIIIAAGSLPTGSALISNGYYYRPTYYYYPAWGYDSANEYYPYDGPIYSYNEMPPDQEIANVQTALQQQG